MNQPPDRAAPVPPSPDLPERSGGAPTRPGPRGPLRGDHSAAAPEHARWNRRIVTILLGWASLVAALGYVGAFAALPLPAIAALVAAGTALPVTFYVVHPGFRSHMLGLDLRVLTAFHAWRVPAAAAFFAYGAWDLLPPAFVRNAAWGDLAAGILAMAVVALPLSRTRLLGFHLFGFADFALAVGTGLAFSLLDVPRMETIATFPILLIPLFGVPISGASHIIALDRLILRRQPTPAHG